MKFLQSLWIALLVAILTACGGAGTSTGVDSVDATTSNPETAVAPDAPSPPPDAPVIPADAGNPTPDVTVTDVAVAPDVPSPMDVPVVDDHAMPPPPDSGMPPFDPALLTFLEGAMLQVQGSTVPAESPILDTQSDGTVRIHISTGFAGAFGCGNTNGVCAGTSCRFSATCTWTDMSVATREIHAHSTRMPDATINVRRP